MNQPFFANHNYIVLSAESLNPEFFEKLEDSTKNFLRESLLDRDVNSHNYIRLINSMLHKMYVPQEALIARLMRAMRNGSLNADF